LGGTVSLVLLLLLISVAGYKLNDMILKNLTVVKKNTLVSASNSYVPPEFISAKNISFAFVLSDYYAETFFKNSSYGYFTL